MITQYKLTGFNRTDELNNDKTQELQAEIHTYALTQEQRLYKSRVGADRYR